MGAISSGKDEAADGKSGGWLLLFGRARGGDPAAKIQLATEIQPYLGKVVRIKLAEQGVEPVKQAQLIDDILQNCQTTIWQKRDDSTAQFEEEFRGWMRKIAITTTLDTLRKLGARKNQWIEYHHTPSGNINHPDGEPTPSGALVEQELHLEQRDKLARAKASLSEDDQRIIQWRSIENRSFDEIAGLMARTKGAVRRLYQRAIKRLREATNDGNGN